MKTTLVRPFPIILQYEECGEKVGRERRLRYYKGIFPYFLLAAVNANTNESVACYIPDFLITSYYANLMY